MSEQVTILYIGGRGRSGSTILARMLGGVSGFVNVGELCQIWDRGFRENQLCGCGQAFRSCEFWNAVGFEAFGGLEKADVEKIRALKPALDRVRHIPRYAEMTTTETYNGRRTDDLLGEYGDILERLYRAIQKVSGAQVIVDSSKRLPYAFLLRALPFTDLRVVHLVRDSRAVAYSWSKTKVRPEIVDHEVLLPRFSPVTTSYQYHLYNHLLGLLSRSTALSFLRYEDFVEAPIFHISRVMAELGFDAVDTLPPVDGHEISLAVNHTVSGNPNRFQTGTVSLRPDEEWRSKMKRTDKYIVTALTSPLLLKYGYFSRGERTTKVRK